MNNQQFQVLMANLNNIRLSKSEIKYNLKEALPFVNQHINSLRAAINTKGIMDEDKLAMKHRLVFWHNQLEKLTEAMRKFNITYH